MHGVSPHIRPAEESIAVTCMGKGHHSGLWMVALGRPGNDIRELWSDLRRRARRLARTGNDVSAAVGAPSPSHSQRLQHSRLSPHPTTGNQSSTQSAQCGLDPALAAACRRVAGGGSVPEIAALPSASLSVWACPSMQQHDARRPNAPSVSKNKVLNKTADREESKLGPCTG